MKGKQDIDELLDVLIIGGSAAGTAAGVYGSRQELKLKIVTSEWGGEVARSGWIGNYPGFIETDGISLSQIFRDQVVANKVHIDEFVTIETIDQSPEGIFVSKAIKEGKPVLYKSKAVLISSGVHPRELNIPGESEFKNKGVSYCTTCDGPLYRNKKVVIIGGGNSALESALMMRDIASAVTIININPEFTGETIYISKLEKDHKVKIIHNAKTNKILGTDRVSSVEYKDSDSNLQSVTCDGVFVHIGLVPNTKFVPSNLELDNFGQIKIDKNCATNIEGLYAAGDCTDVTFKQIVIAAGQGTIAMLSIAKWLNNN